MQSAASSGRACVVPVKGVKSVLVVRSTAAHGIQQHGAGLRYWVPLNNARVRQHNNRLRYFKGSAQLFQGNKRRQVVRADQSTHAKEKEAKSASAGGNAGAHVPNAREAEISIGLVHQNESHGDSTHNHQPLFNNQRQNGGQESNNEVAAAMILLKMTGLTEHDRRLSLVLHLLHAALLLQPQPATAADLPTNTSDGSITSIITFLVAVPFAAWGANLLAGTNNLNNIRRFAKESFAAKLSVALSELPLSEAHKQNFAKAVRDAFGEELVQSKFQDFVLSMLADDNFMAVLSVKADKYLDPKFDKMKEETSNEVKDLGQRMTSLEKEVVGLNSKVDTLIAILKK